MRWKTSQESVNQSNEMFGSLFPWNYFIPFRFLNISFSLRYIFFSSCTRLRDHVSPVKERVDRPFHVRENLVPPGRMNEIDCCTRKLTIKLLIEHHPPIPNGSGCGSGKTTDRSDEYPSPLPELSACGFGPPQVVTSRRHPSNPRNKHILSRGQWF
jgi:hypothetical protein